jgi:propanol-preferring alcohol dehydrogenase
MGLRTIAVDVSPEKGKLCKEAGADVYIDTSTCTDVAAQVKDITGLGGELILDDVLTRCQNAN